jgi:hypothetical protein
MAFSLFSGPKEKIYLILTIDSGSVSGALVSTNKEINQLINKTQARYMFAASMQFRGFKNRDGEKELENVKKALDVVIKTLLSNNTKIDHVHVSFSSPWIISKTNHISIAQEKTFVITEGFLNDIMDKEQKSIEKTMSMDETELIERAMYDTRLTSSRTKTSCEERKPERVNDFEIFCNSINFAPLVRWILFQVEKSIDTNDFVRQRIVTQDASRRTLERTGTESGTDSLAIHD